MVEDIPVEITTQADIAIVAFQATSISDSKGITDASKRIKEHIIKMHPRRVIFDFENVKFFSSQVLGLILDIRSRLNEFSGEVVISAIDPQLYRVFKITNLDRIFRFFPDKNSAVKAVSVK